MPPTPNSDPLTVYALWRSRLPAHNSQSHAPPYIDRYHVVIPPEQPLAVGQRVKILALSLKSYHAPITPNPAAPPVYDTYDPRISGRLLRIRAMAESTVEFVLENETPKAAVIMAYVAIHHIPNHTTALDGAEKVCKWATSGEPSLGFIPLKVAIVEGPTTIAPQEERYSGIDITARPKKARWPGGPGGPPGRNGKDRSGPGRKGRKEKWGDENLKLAPIGQPDEWRNET